MCVGGGVGQHVRRVADGDAARPGGGDIDMVEADAGGGDDFHRLRQARDVFDAKRHAQRDQERVGTVGGLDWLDVQARQRANRCGGIS